MVRKILIDTDTASDDAAALIMAMKSPDLELCGVTSVFGNVPIEQATENALMCLEISGDLSDLPPVYPGAAAPMDGITSPGGMIHGMDGMGDCGLINPVTSPGALNAVDAILHYAELYPEILEILSIGPATNLAQAFKKSPETMKQVKKIYSMSSSGFGPGNITPYAEFNVYCDPQAYKILLGSGIPFCIIGFDVCGGSAFFTPPEIETLVSAGSGVPQFLFNSTLKLRQFMKEKASTEGFSLPDAVAFAVLLDSSLILESQYSTPVIHTEKGKFSGKVEWVESEDSLIEVCRKIDGRAFKKNFFKLITD